jgi:hypothetical protein
MSSLRLFIATGFAVLGLAGCGGGEADTLDQPSTAPTSPAASSAPTSSDSPSFDVAAWRAKWDHSRIAYAQALSTFANQITYLQEHKATPSQIASVLPGLARGISTASANFVTALDKAGPVPADRADLKTAAAKLRATIVAQGKAYGTLAACPATNYTCQVNTFPAIAKVRGTVTAAVNAVPRK